MTNPQELDLEGFVVDLDAYLETTSDLIPAKTEDIAKLAIKHGLYTGDVFGLYDSPAFTALKERRAGQSECDKKGHDWRYFPNVGPRCARCGQGPAVAAQTILGAG